MLGAKLRVPLARPGSISRNALVNRLRAARGGSVVTVVAPAGYGKTTTLTQWADRDDRDFAWVSLDERDNDPLTLLRHLAAALDGLESLPPAVLDALTTPGESVWTSAVPRLTAALESLGPRCVIVLDNASVLRSAPVADVLMAIVDHLPKSSALALAGRSAPPLPLGTLRAEGRLLEIDRDLLALSRREAQQLLRTTGTALLPHELEPLVARSEGWAAGLFLGMLALDDGAGADLSGDDRYLSDYFRTSCLRGLDEPQLAFLRRTSVLDTLSGALCDALLEHTGSAGELEAFEREGLFVIPLDRRREAYRYHPLFRDFLARELREHEPDAPHRLNMRASEWLEFVGDLEGAIAPSAAAGDAERTVRLIAAVGASALDRGDLPLVERWTALVPGSPELDAHPAVSVAAALAHAHGGHSTEAERWLAAAERRRGRLPRPRRARARRVLPRRRPRHARRRRARARGASGEQPVAAAGPPPARSRTGARRRRRTRRDGARNGRRRGGLARRTRRALSRARTAGAAGTRPG